MIVTIVGLLSLVLATVSGWAAVGLWVVGDLDGARSAAIYCAVCVGTFLACARAS